MSRTKLRTPLLLVTALLLSVAAAPPGVAEEGFRLVYFPHKDTESTFTNDWGDPRPGGRRHKGTDIMADKHSEVVAVADGFVIAMREGPRSGYYVRIQHQDGWQSWYMHLNNDSLGTDDGAGGVEGAYPPGLHVGMYVPAGTVVGYVGDSGNAEGGSSHTHFELRKGGRAVNPYPYLAEAHERWVRVMDLADVLR